MTPKRYRARYYPNYHCWGIGFDYGVGRGKPFILSRTLATALAMLTRKIERQQQRNEATQRLRHQRSSPNIS